MAYSPLHTFTSLSFLRYLWAMQAEGTEAHSPMHTLHT